MPRLPDLDSLGARPTPRASNRLATVRNPGALADAVGGLGEDLARRGEVILDQQDKLNYAVAKSSVLKADAEARLQLADDPDFATAEKRYTERMAAAAADASKLIGSNFDRRAFDVDVKTDLARGTFEVRKMALNKQKASDTAIFSSSLDDLQATSRTAPDDATREAAIQTSGQLFDGAVAKGLLTPGEAAEKRRSWSSEYAYGQTMVALDKGDIEGARSLLGKFGKYMTTDSYLKLNAAISNEHDAQSVMSAADAGMGKPIVQAPADVPSAIKHLFPNAEVTSFRRTRAQQDALIASGATAAQNSHHLDGHAIDVKPIEGVAFDDYVKTLKENGVNVIEALDETGKGKGQGTGPHWHVAWTPAVVQPASNVETAVSRAVAALGPNATPKQVEAVRTEVSKRWTLQKAAESEREDSAVEGAQAALIRNGGNWYALPASLRQSVNPKYVPGLINYGEGLHPNAPKRDTDPAEYVRLTTMASTNPRAFAAINPIEYRAKFDEGDWQKLVGARAQLLGKDGGDQGGATIGEIRSITEPMLEARGLSLTGVKKATDRQAMAGRIYGFERAISGDLQVWQVNNPGKKPTTRDIQDIADRRLLQAVQDGRDKYQFELSPGPAKLKIPAVARARVVALMTPILGRQPTDQEIVQAYLREARGS